MNLKKSLFTVGAAAMIAISTIGVASADDAKVNVSLQPNECSVSLTTSEITMGPFEYNGVDGYDLTGKKTQNVQMSMTVPEPDAECYVNFALMGKQLTHDNGVDTIDGSNLTIKPGLSSGWISGPAIPLGAATGATWSLPVESTYAVTRMETVPDNVASGDYSGTLQVTVINTTP